MSRSPYRIGRPCSILVSHTFWPQQKAHHDLWCRRTANRRGEADAGGEDDGDDDRSVGFALAHSISLHLSMLPRSIRRLEFEQIFSFDERTHGFPLQLSALHLPDSITALSLNECVIRPASGSASSLDLSESEWKLPNSLTTLHLGFHVWRSTLTKLRLPHSLTDLHLATWEGKVDQLPTLPPNLRALHMENKFDAPIDSIQWPSTLTSLTLSEAFNHPLEYVRLPDSLTYLDLGDAYNHPIQHVKLPSSLTHLKFGWRFRQPLRDWNPPDSLTELSLPNAWMLGPSQLRLPPNLQTSILPDLFNEAQEPLSLLHLPPLSHLHTFKLGGLMKVNTLAALQLPHSLTALDLGGYCDASLSDVVWPPQLTRLVTGRSFNQPLVDWSPPPSLTELALSDEAGHGGWHLPLSQLRLPPNLRRLTFGSFFYFAAGWLPFPSIPACLTTWPEFQPLTVSGRLDSANHAGGDAYGL